MSIPNTRFSRCAQLNTARAIRASAIGECQISEWYGLSARFWPVARVRHHARKRPHEVNHSAFMRPLPPHQISVCSEISSASSTSIPRYLTVLSNLCPEGHRLDYVPLKTMSRNRLPA